MEEGRTRRTTEPHGGRAPREVKASAVQIQARAWAPRGSGARFESARGHQGRGTARSGVLPLLTGTPRPRPWPPGPPPLPIVRQAAHLGGRQADHFWPLAPPFLQGPASCAHPTQRERIPMPTEVVIALSGLGGVLFGVVSGLGLKGTYARLRLAKLRLNALWVWFLIQRVPHEKDDEDEQVSQ